MKKQKPPMRAFGVRLDAKQVSKARAMGIDTNEIFRTALEKAIKESGGPCPHCGAIRKKSQSSGT